VSMLLYINEVPFYTERPLVQMILSGVFERFPRLKVILTEAGCAWVPPLLDRLDRIIRSIRDTGATGEIRYSDEQVLPRDATEYFHQNVWMGVSQPGQADADARHVIGLDKFMWGSDYPHDEGTYPYTRENLRARFHDAPEAELRQILAGNAAAMYGFDLAALAPLAARVGPRVDEIAQPIDAVPDKTLDRVSSDMDTRAIK
jgi:predicted TIM-barrel fold metal-dependent hydrolase